MILDLSRLTSAEEAEYKLLGDRCGIRWISWFQWWEFVTFSDGNQNNSESSEFHLSLIRFIRFPQLQTMHANFINLSQDSFPLKGIQASSFTILGPLQTFSLGGILLSLTSTRSPFLPCQFHRRRQRQLWVGLVGCTPWGVPKGTLSGCVLPGQSHRFPGISAARARRIGWSAPEKVTSGYSAMMCQMALQIPKWEGEMLVAIQSFEVCIKFNVNPGFC